MKGVAFAMGIVLAICGCAPVVADRCFVRTTTRGRPVAIMTLANRSFKDVVHTTVLFSSNKSLPGRDNRLFDFGTRVRSGQTLSVEGYRTADDSLSNCERLQKAGADVTFPCPSGYDFKDTGNISKGCEVELVTFADGSRWEQGSPL